MRSRAAIVAAIAALALTVSWIWTAPGPPPPQAMNPEVVAAAGTPTPTPTPVPSPTPVPTPTPNPDWVLAIEAAIDAGDADEVLSIFDSNSSEIESFGRGRLEGLDELIDASFVSAIRELDRMVLADDFEAAAAAADRLVARFPDHPDTTRRRRAVVTWAEQARSAQPWSGEVPHLFIHSLIVRTELAFDGDYQDLGYRTYMITRLEFERMLAELYANDYVLIDVHELFEELADGTVVTRPPLVPPGRRPFVFSIDDVSYYDYMAGNGFAERLEIDAQANVATVMVNDDGTEDLTLTGDAMPILDQFVLDNPDFSIGGAKGILALTGYEGVFGYDFSRDQTDEPDFEARRQAAAEIAARLRELGWDFASHSYTHGDWLKNPLSGFGRFTFDGDNWAAEIEPVLGDTDLYISPFGYHLSPNNPRFRYLVDELGFNAFMPISDGVTTVALDSSVVMHRLAVDGFMLTDGAARLAPYFDPAVVIDEARGQP